MNYKVQITKSIEKTRQLAEDRDLVAYSINMDSLLKIMLNYIEDLERRLNKEIEETAQAKFSTMTFGTKE